MIGIVATRRPPSTIAPMAAKPATEHRSRPKVDEPQRAREIKTGSGPRLVLVPEPPLLV
jgi:hypothetical protein